MAKLLKKDDKMFDSLTLSKVKCKCGHINILAKADRMICSWCGNYVYKDKKTEFMYKMKKELNK